MKHKIFKGVLKDPVEGGAPADPAFTRDPVVIYFTTPKKGVVNTLVPPASNSFHATSVLNLLKTGNLHSFVLATKESVVNIQNGLTAFMPPWRL